MRDEEIKVLIKLREGVKKLNMEDIIRHCAERLAYFKVSRSSMNFQRYQQKEFKKSS